MFWFLNVLFRDLVKLPFEVIATFRIFVSRKSVKQSVNLLVTLARINRYYILAFISKVRFGSYSVSVVLNIFTQIKIKNKVSYN